MKRNYSICFIGIICGLLSYTTATATNITVDGSFGQSEWVGYSTNDDGVGSGGYVNPGYGGQAYDVEHTGLYFDSNTLYFGLQTGFDLVNGTTAYQPGDFALDVNGDNAFDYAIDYTIATDGSVALSVYDVTEWTNTAISAWETIFEMSSGTLIGTGTGAFSSGDFNNVDGGISYVLEGNLDMNLFSDWNGSDDITLQWTMGCGNDVGTVTSAPVPEPATLLLFGTGLVGLAGFTRKKKE